MNDLAREKLVQAALGGVPQIRGQFKVGDGLCALGVLGFSKDETFSEFEALLKKYGFRSGHPVMCPMDCGYVADEFFLTYHLNDEHSMDFLTIARKMP